MNKSFSGDGGDKSNVLRCDPRLLVHLGIVTTLGAVFSGTSTIVSHYDNKCCNIMQLDVA